MWLGYRILWAYLCIKLDTCLNALVDQSSHGQHFAGLRINWILSLPHFRLFGGYEFMQWDESVLWVCWDSAFQNLLYLLVFDSKSNPICFSVLIYFLLHISCSQPFCSIQMRETSKLSKSSQTQLFLKSCWGYSHK